MPELWIHLGVPAFLWWALWFSEGRSVRRDVEKARVRFTRARIRQLEAIEHEQVRIVGKVVATDSATVNLGTSKERPDQIRGNPILEGEPFVIQTADGRRFRLRPAEIRIESLPGAERKLVRTITTEDGVEQTYSFEVPDGFELMVIGRASEAAEGAFREGPIELAPLEGRYRLGVKLRDVRATPEPPKVDTSKSVSWLGGVLALMGAGLAFIPYLGVILWIASLVILALVAVVFFFGSFSVDYEPLSFSEEEKLAELEKRVRVEEPAAAEDHELDENEYDESEYEDELEDELEA